MVARVRGSAGLRGIGTLALASGAGQLAVMSTLPIATRLYAPADFGQFALLTSFTGIATVAACLCLDLAIVQGADGAAADELFAAALRSLPLTALVSALVLWGLIARGLFGYGKLALSGVAVTAALVALNGLYVASRYRQLREQHYGLIASATLFQNLGRAVAPLLWWPLTRSWAGLALGELSARAIGTRRLIAPLLAAAWRHPAFREHGAWWRVVRREWRYTGVLLTSVIIDTGSSLIVAPMLAAAYGAEAAGEYYLVTTFLNAPLALVGTAFADVIHARSAQLMHADPRALPGFVRRAAAGLLGIGALIYVPLWVLAPWLLPRIFGSQWHETVQVTRGLTPFMIMAFVASPCSRVLVAVRQTGIKMAADVLRLLVAPATILLAQRSTAPFAQAILWFGLAMAGAYALYFGGQYYSAVRVSRRTPGALAPVHEVMDVQE